MNQLTSISAEAEPLPSDTTPRLPELASGDLPVEPPSSTPSAEVAEESPDLTRFADIKIKVQAVLGGMTMPIADLLALRSGSVVDLDRRVGEPVDLVVHGRAIARGELVLVDGALGLTLTEIVRPDR